MTSHTVETAPQLYARIAAVLYVIIIILAVFAPFAVAPSGLTRADVATTVAEILASKSRYSLGGAAELIVCACDIGVALIFYELLRPVSRSLALLAVFFRLAFPLISIVLSEPGATTSPGMPMMRLMKSAGDELCARSARSPRCESFVVGTRVVNRKEAAGMGLPMYSCGPAAPGC